MTSSRKGLWAIIIVVILGIVVLLLVLAAGGTSSLPPTGSQSTTSSTTQMVVADYACDGGKTIDATYFNATTSTTAGNSIQLSLSDGRQMTLQQTISADGARYSNANPQIAAGQPGAETFVFWSKGNGAIVEENGTTSAYTNCTVQTQ